MISAFGTKRRSCWFVKIPAGYRDWRLISVKQLAGNKLKQLRAQLGNVIAIEAFREGKLMVKDSKKYAASGGWGYADFTNGKPGDQALHEKCSPATPLKKITTTSSHVTHLRPELKFAPNLAVERRD